MRQASQATLFAIALLFAAPASRAAESYDNCAGTITSLPATLTTQGVWCLESDLATAITTGAAIMVAANNITIDCNHFKLGGLAAGPETQAYGIRANNRMNTVVRNCNVRGFSIGIYIADGGGALIEDNRVEANNLIGVAVFGHGSTVRRNQVVDSGGRPSGGSVSFGISAAYSTDVIDNTVNGVIGSGIGGDVVGIASSVNYGASISRNRISNLTPGDGRLAWGIDETTSRVVIDDNHMIGPDAGTTVGIRCSSANSMASRNAIMAFATGIIDCYSLGNFVNPN